MRATWKNFHATLQPDRHEEIVHFQIVMQHLFTTSLRTNPIGRVQSNRAKEKEARVSSGRGS